MSLRYLIYFLIIFNEMSVVIKLQEFLMSKDIDFPKSNLSSLSLKIIKPLNKEKIVQPEIKKKNNNVNSIKIEKSFIPEEKSELSAMFRPDIEKTKQFLKRKAEREKKNKILLAEGKINREDLENKSKIKAQEVIIDQKITIDQSGQTRDQKGNLIFVGPRQNQLKINQKISQEVQLKTLEKNRKKKATLKMTRNFIDPNLVVGTSKKRIRRSMLGLQFLGKGSYQTFEVKRETKKQIQNLEDALNDCSNEEIQVRTIKSRKAVKLEYDRQVPLVEWWDIPLLNIESYSMILEKLKAEESNLLNQKINIDSFIHIQEINDQVSFQKVGSQNQKESRIIMPMYMTKDQRKKLKRKRKREKLLQKNDQIKLGLIQPEKPKLKIGNMAIVMKNEFVLDPSRVQNEAKKQTQDRLNKHLEANSSRKLTKVQRKAKAIRKLKKDSSKQCRRLVFRIHKLTDPSHIFKVNMNAKQLALSGFIIKSSNQYSSLPVLIIIEGGVKATKFYKNLMMNRIRWNEHDTSNKCELIWEGVIDGSIAGKWKTQQVNDEVEAIKFLTEKKLEHFWDYVCTN